MSAFAHRRAVSVLAVAAAAMLGASGCGDPYLHTNPYDPDFPVSFAITGPDTVFSVDEVAQYSVQITPVFPDSAVQWAIDTVTINTPSAGDTIVDGATVFAPIGPGAYRAIDPPLEPATVKIAVAVLLGGADTTVSRNFKLIETQVYRHAGYKEVILTQRLTRIRLRCPATQVCDTVAVGGTWSVWVDGFDALNNQIHSLIGVNANPRTGTPVVTYATRDTTVATVLPDGVRAATVTARRSGVTWIVATRGALRDSLQLVVQ